MKPTAQYIRLVYLQDYCFKSRKKRWAKQLGERLRELIADNPYLGVY